jgi:preprotein translocase subunit SecG
MTTVLILIHLMIVVAMIGLVLLQRSEGGALGIGGGSGAFMSGRGAGNVLTTTTAFLAAAFFITSIGLAILAKLEGGPSDIFDILPGQRAPATVETPAPLPGSGAAPGSAEGMLEQLGGSAGPQTAPTGSGAGSPSPSPSAPAGGETLPVPEGGAVPQIPPVESGQ